MKILKTPPYIIKDRYKLKDIGFWDKNGNYKENYQLVNTKELKYNNGER